MSTAILPAVLATVEPVHEEGWRFWHKLASMAPVYSDANSIADRLGVCRTTLRTRFRRAGLPSPKELLVGWRLCLAAGMFDRGGRTIADVAYGLMYASPQSFSRHVSDWRGLRAGEFRERRPFNVELDHYLGIIRPTAHVWADFRPTTGARQAVAA